MKSVTFVGHVLTQQPMCEKIGHEMHSCDSHPLNVMWKCPPQFVRRISASCRTQEYWSVWRRRRQLTARWHICALICADCLRCAVLKYHGTPMRQTIVTVVGRCKTLLRWRRRWTNLQCASKSSPLPQKNFLQYFHSLLLSLFSCVKFCCQFISTYIYQFWLTYLSI